MTGWPMAGLEGREKLQNILKNNGGSCRHFCFWKELHMNFISNIWNHPKTSAAGLMIAIISISGVLSQQGITLGSAGTGTVVALVGSLATALLGLLAKDPGQSQSSSSVASSAKLGVWALIALLLPLPFVSGCSGKSVAQDIVNWTPALQSAVATVDSTAAMLAPADAPIFAAATVGFDAASNLLVTQAKAYLANPSAVALAKLQAAVVALQQNVSAATLSGLKIVDQKSQTLAMNAIDAVGTIINAILALVISVSSQAQVSLMAGQSSIKLAQVRAYRNEGKAAEMVAGHYGETIGAARVQVARAEHGEAQAGF
jgi:hypothetical protein